MRAAVVAGSDFDFSRFDSRADIVVAADSGYKYLVGRVRVDAVIGDFDSLGYTPDGVEIVKYDAHKDATDLSLAIEYTVDGGADEIDVYGAVGGRLDHTLAAMQVCANFAKRGVKIRMRGVREDVYFVLGKLELDDKKGKTVSVFAQTEATGVNLEGMEYPLAGATLTCDYPIGVSNVVTNDAASVNARSGLLIVVENLERV